MADNKINLELEIQHFQEFRRDLIDSIKMANDMSSEFDGVTTNTKELQKTLDGVNKVIAILTTKVTTDGKMSISTAKELREVLTTLDANALSLVDAEDKRMDPGKFKERLKFLTDENSILQQNLRIVEEQTAELEKQQEKLQKETTISLYTKGKRGLSDGVKNAINNFSDEQLRSMVTPTGKKGDYTKAQKQILEDNGISVEDARTIQKIYVEMNRNAELTKKTIEQINEKIAGANTKIAEEQNKVQQLLTTGVNTGVNAEGIASGVEGISPTLNRLIEDADKTNKKFIDMNGSLNKTTDSFGALRKAIISSRVVMNVLKKVMQEAIRTVKEMDKALTGMTAVTGKSREEVLKLIPELKKLAQQTSSTMTEVANLTTEYLRQGRSLEDSMELAKETARAAKIAEISTTESLTYMTSAINGFNLSASDAARVSDVFANVAAKTATDYEQLAIALSKVSAQANLAGMSMEYTTALLAKGIETTQEAPESIGTALKTVIARMRELTSYDKVLEDGTDVNKVEASLNAVGISLRDATGKFRDLEDVFNELGPKWDSLNTMQQQAIAQAVAGTRQQSRFIAIMQDWERTMENVTTAEESAGAAAYQYSKMSEGLEATLTNLTTSWQGFTTSLVNTEFVIDILKGITGFLNTMSEISGFWKVIGISALSLVGITKVQNKLIDYRYRKHLELAVLEEQAKNTEIKSGEELRKQLVITQARVDMLSLEYQIDQEEYMLKRLAYEQEKSITREELEQYLINKGMTKEVAERYILESAALGKLQAQNEALWLTKLKHLGTDIGILFTNTSNLTQAQAQHILENRSLLNQIALLFMSRKKLEALRAQNKEYAAQLLLQKKAVINGLKMVGTMLLIAAAIAGIVYIIKTINELTQAQEKALKSIEEHSNNIYELNQKSGDLNKLIDEYEKLYNTVNRTAEQEERLLELEKELESQEGVSGRGASLLASAKSKDASYKAKISDEQDAMISDVMKAFKETAEKTDFFKNANFENAFKRKFEMEIDSNLEEELSNAVAAGIITMEQYRERLRYAQNIGSGLMQNLDSQSIAEEGWSRQQANQTFWTGAPGETMGTVAAGVGAGAVGAGAGILAAMGIGTAIGTAAGPWGIAIGAIVGALIGIGTAVVAVIKANSQKNADEAAEQVAYIMKEYTAEITEFSKNMSLNMDESLAKKYEIIKQTIENQDYSDLTKNAIEEMFSTVIAVFENPKIKNLANRINKVLGKKGDKVIEDIATAFQGLGDASMEAGFNIVAAALESGKSDSEAMKELYVAVSDKNSIYFKEGEAKWNETRQQQIDNIKSQLDHEKTLKAYAKQNDTTVEAYRKELQEQLAELENATYEFSDERQQILDKTFSLITGSSSVLELQQTLASLDSANKSLLEINEALNEGTLSFEQLTQLATILNDEADIFYTTLREEGMEGIRSLITTSLVGPYDQYLKQIDDFILGQQAIIESNDADSAAAKAAQQNIDLVNEYRKSYMTFNKESFEAYMLKKKIAVLEKDINEGNINSYKELISIKEKEKQEAQDRLNQYFKTYPQEMELIKKIRSGTISLADAWAQVGDKENFKRLVENSESWFEAIEKTEEDIQKLKKDSVEKQIEIQNKAIDVYKEKLEEEKEALQESLDKRKEAYEKYFDDLEDANEEESFEDQQKRLQQAIAALSTASDANSLAKLKEYQEQLQELEDEKNKSDREKRREAVMDNIDNQSEATEQYYDERLKNEQKLWEELSSLSVTELEMLYTTYNEEYKKSTDLNKQYLLESFKTTIKGIQSMTGVSLPGYSNGGLVKHTGLAAVHGSSSKPEAFLDASQTAMFAELTKSLQAKYTKGQFVNNYNQDNSSIVIDGFNININADLNNGNMRQTGESLANALLEGLRRTGISVNMKK